MSTPQEVLDAIEKLDGDDQAIVKDYLIKLKEKIVELEAKLGPEEVAEEEEEEPTPMEEEEGIDEPEFPPLYSSGEDFDKASECKAEASELKSQGKWEEALEKYTEAVLAAEPSPLLYGNRAIALLKLGRPHAAERDCTEALKINPDSAKALRVRGKARKELGKYEEARHDLSEAQQIDFDEDTVEDLKFVSDKCMEVEKAEAHKRVQEEERLRKRAEEIRKAQEEAKKEEAEASSSSARSSASSSGGMPGGSMPGGMGGLMAEIMKDPELAGAMQNPKVMAALSDPMALMNNPAKLQELMADPEVGPVLKKLMGKMGGGMPGGMGAGGTGDSGGADDIPNMGGSDDDDMPDLE